MSNKIRKITQNKNRNEFYYIDKNPGKIYSLLRVESSKENNRVKINDKIIQKFSQSSVLFLVLVPYHYLIFVIFVLICTFLSFCFLFFSSYMSFKTLNFDVKFRILSALFDCDNY